MTCVETVVGLVVCRQWIYYSMHCAVLNFCIGHLYNRSASVCDKLPRELIQYSRKYVHIFWWIQTSQKTEYVLSTVIGDSLQLHRAEHRLNDMEKPRSDDVLWNLPDYLFSLIEDDHSQSTSYCQVWALNESKNQAKRKKKISEKRFKLLMHAYCVLCLGMKCYQL